MKYILMAAVLALTGPALAAEPAAPTSPAPAATQTVSLDQLRQMLLGTWQRDDETAFTRELATGGTVIDRFEGDDTATTRGTWQLVKGDALLPDRAGHKPPADSVFLQLSQNGEQALFNVVAVNAQAMQVIDIGSGKTFRFSRLK